MSYGLRVTGYELRVTSYELRVTSYGLRVTGYKLPFTGSRLTVYRPGIMASGSALRVYDEGLGFRTHRVKVQRLGSNSVCIPPRC
jgi:hypothetical protein